jgi:hypothetical protein
MPRTSREDRKENATNIPSDLRVEYVVIDRLLEEKMQTRGARPEDLIEDHDRTSNLTASQKKTLRLPNATGTA